MNMTAMRTEAIARMLGSLPTSDIEEEMRRRNRPSVTSVLDGNARCLALVAECLQILGCSPLPPGIENLYDSIAHMRNECAMLADQHKAKLAEAVSMGRRRALVLSALAVNAADEYIEQAAMGLAIENPSGFMVTSDDDAFPVVMLDGVKICQARLSKWKDIL